MCSENARADDGGVVGLGTRGRARQGQQSQAPAQSPTVRVAPWSRGAGEDTGRCRGTCGTSHTLSMCSGGGQECARGRGSRGTRAGCKAHLCSTDSYLHRPVLKPGAIPNDMCHKEGRGAPPGAQHIDSYQILAPAVQMVMLENGAGNPTLQQSELLLPQFERRCVCCRQ